MPPFDRSILSLVLWRVTAVMVVFSTILAVIIHIQIDDTLLLLRDRTVYEQALGIASYLEKSEDTLILDMPAAERDFYASQGKLYQYVVRNKAGDVLFNSPIAFIDRFPDKWPGGETRFFEFTGPKGTTFLGAGIEHRFNGEPYLIQAAQSEESAEAFTQILATKFLTRMAWASIPFFILLLAVIYVSIRQSLTPVQKASKQAQEISFKSSGLRISEENIPREILPLVNAVNGALDRLEKGVEGQKEFTANAAHELRTPLSILRSQIGMIEDAEIRDKLTRDVDSMGRLVSQLLAIARLDFPENLPMEKIDLTALVIQVSQDFWQAAIREKRELRVAEEDGPVYVAGHYDALCRALRNLLENAAAHTPAGTPVEIIQDRAAVSIRDHGKGIAASDMDKIFQRFWRKSKKGNGAGLGLSIVRRIAELHQGEISCRNQPEGGCVFTLSLKETPAEKEISSPVPAGKKPPGARQKIMKNFLPS